MSRQKPQDGPNGAGDSKDPPEAEAPAATLQRLLEVTCHPR